MREAILSMLIAALTLAPFALAHGPSHVGGVAGTPKPYCENGVPPPYILMPGLETTQEKFIHEYAQGLGRIVLNGQDGNLDDCDSDGAPSDFDYHFEYANGGANLLYEANNVDLCWFDAAPKGAGAIHEHVPGAPLFVGDNLWGGYVDAVIAADNFPAPCGDGDIDTSAGDCMVASPFLTAAGYGPRGLNAPWPEPLQYRAITDQGTCMPGVDGAVIVFVGSPSDPATQGHVVESAQLPCTPAVLVPFGSHSTASLGGSTIPDGLTDDTWYVPPALPAYSVPKHVGWQNEGTDVGWINHQPWTSSTGPGPFTYAVDFQVPASAFSTFASIHLTANYAVDDAFQAKLNSLSYLIGAGSGWSSWGTMLYTPAGPAAFQPGTNTLYIEVHDGGGVATGLMMDFEVRGVC